MSLRITVVPASTNAGRETIRALLNSGVDPIVHGVYRDVSKVPTEFTKNENFIATTGDVSTGIGLDFMGSDAVLYIPPPPATGSDLDEFATRTANNVKKALSTAPSVKRLLLFSSMGAQYDREIGILRLNHLSNRILEQAAAEVLIIKPGLFHELWAHVFETTKDDPPVIYSTISPSDHKVPMVSVTDVGVVCAEKLLETGQDIPSSPHSFDLYGPRNYSSEDIKAAVEDILQKEIQLVTIPPEGLAEFYSSRGYPKDQVPWSVEMTTAALPGGIMAGDFEGNEHTIWAKQELVTSLRKMYEAQRAT